MSEIMKLAGPPPPHPNSRLCAMGRIITDLTPEERDALQKALDNPAWLGSRIAEILNSAGHRVREEALRLHRRGGCSCNQMRATQ